MGFNREASKRVQKDCSTIDIIGDPKAGVRMRGKPNVNDRMVGHFVERMSSEFEMSPVGELAYFLGL